MLLGPVLFWSGNVVLARAMATEIAPVSLAFWRWTIALLIFLPFGFTALRRDWPVIRQHFRLMLLLGGLGVAGYNTFVYVGLQSTAATNVLLINSFIPVFIILLTALLLREVISVRNQLAIVISGAGVAVLILRADLANLTALQFNPGDLWILLAATCWALYSIGLRWRPVELSASAFLLITMIIGVIMLLPVYLWFWWQGETFELNAPNLVTIAYVAMFASVGAFLLWNQGVKLVGAAIAGQYIHLMPVLGTIMAVSFLGEQLYFYHIIGALAIGSGVYLAVTSRPNK